MDLKEHEGFSQSSQMLGAYFNHRDAGHHHLSSVHWWSLNLYECTGDISMNEGSFIPFKKGQALIIPPGVRKFRFKKSGVHHAFHFESEVKLQPLTLMPKPVGRICFDVAKMALMCFQKQPWRSSRLLGEMLMQYFEAQHDHKYEWFSPSLVKSAMEIMISRGFNDISIGEIARQLKVSHNHLTRQFILLEGMGPKQCLQSLRYQKCCELISQTDLSPKAIAMELGFKDLQPFNKFIKKMSGLSPRALIFKIRSID
jgi:AraC-like DNA-binding protein